VGSEHQFVLPAARGFCAQNFCCSISLRTIWLSGEDVHYEWYEPGEPPAHDSVLRALRVAHEEGVRTVFDVDYRANTWSCASASGEAARKALPLADIVLANEEELALLTGSDDPEHQVESVLKVGPAILVQKLGPRGVAAHTASERHFAPSRAEHVVCAIGGGNGFAAGFLYALYCGYDLERALLYGNAAAAVVVSRVRARAQCRTCPRSEARLAEQFSASQSRG
jgi:sugar/nucleoside kinase (ribokinase family)